MNGALVTFYLFPGGKMALTNIAYKIHYTCGKDIKPSYDLVYDNQNLTYYGSQLTYHKSSSESFLPLGRDGDYFEISGYTNIEEMRSLGIGMQVVLVFETPTTLVHSENLILPEDKNINTNPHHAYRFIEYDTGKWKMLVSDTISSTYDSSAVHVNTANEINFIESKSNLNLNDILILEDSDDAWNKKKYSGYQIARTGKEEKIGSNPDYGKSNFIYEDFPEGFILSRFNNIGALHLHDIFVIGNITYLSGYIEGTNKESIIAQFSISGSISFHNFDTTETDVLGSFDIVAYNKGSDVLYTIEKTTNHTEKFILKLSNNTDYERISIGHFPSANENPSCITFCDNFFNLLIGTDGGRILKGGGIAWNTRYTGGLSITIRKIIQTGSSSFIALLFDSNTSQCSLLKTNNSGITWNIIASNLPDLKTICFSFQNYIIALDNNNVYVFKENKDDFNILLTVNNETLKTIHYLGNGIIFVSGYESGVSYDLWLSYDFGKTWKHSKLNDPYEIISTSYSDYIDGITILAKNDASLYQILFIPTNQEFYDFGVSFSEFENTDKNAIHKNISSEILEIPSKTTPIGTDIFVIEDSNPSYVVITYDFIPLTYNTNSLTYIDKPEGWQKKSVALMNLDLPGIDSTSYHSNVAGEYVTSRQGQKTVPIGTDRLIIEDSENSFIKKFIEIDDIPANNNDPTAIHLDSTSPEIGTLSFDTILPEDVLVIEKVDGTKRKLAFSSIPTAHDSDAIHKSVPNEINLIDELISPDNDDYVLIELNDPTEGNRVKKKVKLANLPTSSGGEINFGINEGGGSIEWYSGKDGSGLKFRTLDIDTSTGLEFVFPGSGNYVLSINDDSLKTYLNLNLNDIADSNDYVKIAKIEKIEFQAGTAAAGTALTLATFSEAWIQLQGTPLKDFVYNNLDPLINNTVIPQINYLNNHIIDDYHAIGNGIELIEYRAATRALWHKTINTADDNFLDISEVNGITFTVKNLTKQVEDNEGDGNSLIRSFNKEYGENNYILKLRKIKSLNDDLLPLTLNLQSLNLEIDIKDVVTELRKIGNKISVLNDLERTDDNKFYRIPVRTISSPSPLVDQGSNVVLLEDNTTGELLLRGRRVSLENKGQGAPIGRGVIYIGNENAFKNGTAESAVSLRTLRGGAGIIVNQDDEELTIVATGETANPYYVRVGVYPDFNQPTDTYDEPVMLCEPINEFLTYWPGYFEKTLPTQPANAYFHRTIKTATVNINNYPIDIGSHVTLLSVRPMPSQEWEGFGILSPYLEPRHTLRPNFLQISGIIYRKPKPSTDKKFFKKCVRCIEKVTDNMFTLVHDGLGFIEFPFLNKNTVEDDTPISVYRGVVDTSDEEDKEDLGYNLFASLKSNNVQVGEDALSLTLSSYEGYEGAIIELNFDSTKIQRLGIQNENLNMGGNLIHGSASIPWDFDDFDFTIPTLYDIKNNYPICLYDTPHQFTNRMELKYNPGPNDLIMIEDRDSNPIFKKKYITLSSIPKPPQPPFPFPIFPEFPWDKDSRRWFDEPTFIDTENPFVTFRDLMPDYGGLKVLSPSFWVKFLTFPFKLIEESEIFDEFNIYFKSIINDDIIKFIVPSIGSTNKFDMSSSQSGVTYIINNTVVPEKFITVFIEENEGLTDKNKIRKNFNHYLKEDYTFSQYSLGQFNFNENPRTITWTHETDAMLIGTYSDDLIPTEDSLIRIFKGSVDNWSVVYSSIIENGDGGVTKIAFIDLNTCIAVINETYPTIKTILLKSENNGDSWEPYSTINNIAFENLLLISNEVMIGKAEDKLYLSLDKGITFDSTPIWDKTGYEVNDMVYVSYNVALIGGKNDYNYPFLAITEDGGTTWEENSFPNLDMESFADIEYEAENNTVYCFGSLISDPKTITTYSCPLPEVSGVNDNMAFHVNQGNEIDALEEKIYVSSDDLLLVEDSADDNQKKKVKVGNFGGSSLKENKTNFAGAYYPYGMIPNNADDWPYVRLGIEYQAPLYPAGHIHAFNIAVDGTKIAIGSRDQAGSDTAAIYFQYPNSSTWSNKYYGTLNLGAYGFTDMTITPNGYCYFSLRDEDHVAPPGNNSVLTGHQTELEHLTEINLPTSWYYFYQTTMTYIPYIENEILVARAVLEQYATPGFVEVYRIANNTPTKVYEHYSEDNPGGFFAIKSFMTISKNFIIAIRSHYYDSYTVFLEYNIGDNTWTEISTFYGDAFNKCVYLGSGYYVAISNYKIFVSSDNCQNWVPVFETNYQLYDISYIGYNSLIVNGAVEGSYSVVLFSFDFGNTWQEQLGIKDHLENDEKYKIISLFPGRRDGKIYGVGAATKNKVYSITM